MRSGCFSSIAKEISMFGKLLGAAAGAEAAKFTSAFGGPAGAVMGALAVPLVRRRP